MNTLKNKYFYKFLIPSLIGAFLFVTPIKQDGNLTIPIAVLANKLLDLMGDYTMTIIWFLISLSAILTVLHRCLGLSTLKKNVKLDELFGVRGFWFWVRMIGFVFANMIYFGVGPDFIIGELTGGVVVYDLMPILVCVFLLAGLLLALLLNYGLLDLCGALMIKLMRPMLTFCDNEKMVAYLETNKESNVSLYKHYGFELKKEEIIPKTNVTHYAMVRYLKGK